MRITISVFCSLGLILSYNAVADETRLASSGTWTTVSDTADGQKVCAVRADFAGGRFILYGKGDKPNTLRLIVQARSWDTLMDSLPIDISFDSRHTLEFQGSANHSIVRAEIPTDQVKDLIHYLTAGQQATLIFPRQADMWLQFDLHGATPTVNAMGECLEAANIWLPPPFPQAPGAPASTQPTAEAAPPSAPVVTGHDLISRIVQKQSRTVDAMGFSREYLDKRLVINLAGSYTKFVSLRQLLAILFESHEYTSIKQYYSIFFGQGFSIKKEAVPTVNIILREDGDELYIESAGSGDSTDNLSDTDMAQLGPALMMEVISVGQAEAGNSTR